MPERLEVAARHPGGLGHPCPPGDGGTTGFLDERPLRHGQVQFEVGGQDGRRAHGAFNRIALEGEGRAGAKPLEHFGRKRALLAVDRLHGADGRGYPRLVLNAWDQRPISTNAASDYLGVKPRHFTDIRRELSLRPSMAAG